MSENIKNTQNLIYALFTIVSLVILIDFAFSGSVNTDDILNTEKNREQYYNAAGNSHRSFKVITNTHEFYVSEDFAKSIISNEKIEYAISPIFKEVNWYRMLSSEDKSFYSLRVMSGLVLPLLVIIAMAIAYKTERNIAIIVFLFQVLLTANLIFLIV